MPEYKRFDDNKLFFSNQIDDTDIVPFTHEPNGANDEDGKLHLSQIQCIPYGECTTASDEQIKKISFLNRKYFEDTVLKITEDEVKRDLLIGRKIRVKFINPNLHENPKLQAGDESYPITLNGLQVGPNFNAANEVLEFAFTGTSWELVSGVIGKQEEATGSEYVILQNGNKKTKILLSKAVNAVVSLSMTEDDMNSIFD